VNKLAWITLLGSVLLASCSAAGPVRQFEKGEELVFNDFSETDSFEQGGYEGARLQIADGVYRITVTQGDSTFWWGQWGATYDNVVIDVDVNQLSERNDNMYGVMCRARGAVGQPVTPDPILEAIMEAGEAEDNAPAQSDEEVAPADATDEATVEVEADATEAATEEAQDEADDEATEEAETSSANEDEATEEATAEVTEEAIEATEEATAEATEDASSTVVNNGDSYLFLIRGDGGYAIMRARGRDIQALAGWGTTSAITQGPGQNHIRAVCIGDYLALYVNDTFVADAIDDAYNQGQVGLAAASVDRLGVVVEFDNLSISQANPG
jgi:hypothetical protein